MSSKPSEASARSSDASASRASSLATRVAELPTSAWFLVGANLLPLVGVLALGWDLGDILLLYWAESAVIGVSNVAKMLSKRSWSNLFFVPFFAVHYGGFMLGHLVFLVALIVPLVSGEPPSLEAIAARARGLAPGVLALAISHGASFYLNFLRGGERERTDVSGLFMAPYGRIVVMHLTIIFGAFVALFLGAGIGPLLVLVPLKIAVDLRAHLAERRKAMPRPEPTNVVPAQ